VSLSSIYIKIYKGITICSTTELASIIIVLSIVFAMSYDEAV